ncbi:MAG: tetratricopeptide repeat protein, partial [Verrucomicrobiaceae bacterium]|nr:tetratricopeptide repeat protein [Verrucomicrobiaceae bacterium]NCF94038.1 tetratricopeptide repeat protein [Verrucomicrobiaceae bacterium]
NHAKAKLLAERALAIQEKALPLGHLDLADTLETLAEIHTGLGNTKEANRYASRAKAIREKLSSSK